MELKRIIKTVCFLLIFILNCLVTLFLGIGIIQGVFRFGVEVFNFLTGRLGNKFVN